MFITVFHEKDQPCGLQGRLFPEKKHHPRTAEETGCFFHLLFSSLVRFDRHTNEPLA